MSKQKNSLASLLLLATGALVGAAGTLLYKELTPKKPQLILEDVKEQFSQYGKVTGSWIDYDPIEYELYESKPLVYSGGISRQEEHGIVTYSFIADAYSGDILDIYEYKA
ncbi:TPA: hypothetical protein ACGO1T_000976 [Streptococcus suis]